MTQNIYNRLSWDKGEPLPPDMTQLAQFTPDIPIPDASMYRARGIGIKNMGQDVDIQAI